MRHALIAATGLALISTVAQAQPVSGLYVGAGGGAAFLQDEQASGPLVSSTGRQLDRFKTGYAGLASLGYGFGNGLRLELEGSIRSNLQDNALPSNQRSHSFRETKYGGMANALFDMDIGSPYIFPYFGGGAGYMSVNDKASVNYVNGATGSLDQDKGAFAYQGIAGVSFPIPYVVGLSLTAEYRFLGLAGKRNYTTTISGAGPTFQSSRSTKVDDTHNILIGLRYVFNVTPPAGPAPASPVSAAAPAPATAARSYLVFFDWDRADLTDRARQIIAEAASASTKVQTTRIEVAGHADRTGAEAYNQALSRKRAEMVSGELVRLGVPAKAISVTAYGDTRPLVPTAAGVREPQNRRVEIVLK